MLLSKWNWKRSYPLVVQDTCPRNRPFEDAFCNGKARVISISMWLYRKVNKKNIKKKLESKKKPWNLNKWRVRAWINHRESMLFFVGPLEGPYLITRKVQLVKYEIQAVLTLRGKTCPLNKHIQFWMVHEYGSCDRHHWSLRTWKTNVSYRGECLERRSCAVLFVFCEDVFIPERNLLVQNRIIMFECQLVMVYAILFGFVKSLLWWSNGACLFHLKSCLWTPKKPCAFFSVNNLPG